MNNVQAISFCWLEHKKTKQDASQKHIFLSFHFFIVKQPKSVTSIYTESYQNPKGAQLQPQSATISNTRQQMNIIFNSSIQYVESA
jgi:hypothetical protein